jgi:hypothetical protein
MPKTNLSLGNLFKATSGSDRLSSPSSLNARNASAGTSISIGAFAIDSVTVTPPTFTYIVESTSENATFTFGSAGTAHAARVASISQNYTVSFNNVNFTVGGATLGATTTFPVTPASIAVSTYSEAESILSMKYNDNFNTSATNYNTTVTKTLFAVDVYNTINQADFCLLFDTPVTKADNTVVNIEDLAVGDVIKAWVPAGLPDESLDGTDTEETEWRMFNSETAAGEYQDVTVSDITFNFASGYYNINNGLIKATGTHPLYVFSLETQKYHFKIVETILPGDSILTYDENDGLVEVLVYDVAKIIEDVEIVTLNVENADVYLANGTISHNKGTTTQPSIPASGLRMYLEPGKANSFAGGLPATGTPTVDLLDMSGYGTGVRPGAQGPLSLASGNPSYNNGGSRKTNYYSFNGTSNLFYKDTASNINGGISQFNTNTGTIHMWIRPTTTLGVASRPIFDYAGFYKLSIESTNNSALDRVTFTGSSLGTGSHVTSLSSNIWYLISATFQPSGFCTVYLDGTELGSFTAAAFTAPSSTNYVTIGSNTGRTLFWNGQIGPVLFYNVFQNATSVARVYNYFSPNYK